jgi:hypothetical protein
MKSIATFVFFSSITLPIVAQSLSREEIDRYCKDIITKQEQGKLVEYLYPNISICGGMLSGWFDQDKLVIISAFNKGDFEMIHRTYYLKDSVFYAATDNRRRPILDVDEFCKTHKTKEGSCDFANIPYERVVTTIFLTDKLMVSLDINGVKQELPSKDWMVEKILECGKLMRSELGKKKVLFDRN